jgi:hypothetical protein
MTWWIICSRYVNNVNTKINKIDLRLKFIYNHTDLLPGLRRHLARLMRLGDAAGKRCCARHGPLSQRGQRFVVHSDAHERWSIGPRVGAHERWVLFDDVVRALHDQPPWGSTWWSAVRSGKPRSTSRAANGGDTRPTGAAGRGRATNRSRPAEARAKRRLRHLVYARARHMAARTAHVMELAVSASPWSGGEYAVEPRKRSVCMWNAVLAGC